MRKLLILLAASTALAACKPAPAPNNSASGASTNASAIPSSLAPDTGPPAPPGAATGRIYGEVKDPSGMFVSGATVMVTDTTTMTSQTVTADATGMYQRNTLQAGHGYTLAAMKDSGGSGPPQTVASLPAGANQELDLPLQ